MPDLLFRYWGKAKPDREDGPQYHPLPYHCLDVAAVGQSWWDKSPVIVSSARDSVIWVI
ncbi:MAG TPA: HD domain-containing protein [Gammaproteobacteria bacterium]|nr:HD domain-containing protein [Gammaproteobacteria bacterium]